MIYQVRQNEPFNYYKLYFSTNNCLFYYFVPFWIEDEATTEYATTEDSSSDATTEDSSSDVTTEDSPTSTSTDSSTDGTNFQINTFMKIIRL